MSQQPTITKVLIANRGEIAIRVIRAARDLGIASVAVYAEPDVDAIFVRMADEAFALGGQTSAESYLNIEKVIAAAKAAGADAIHPGYGFLSENADFAEAVIDAGITWIGPSPQAIRSLGDKVTARNIAKSVDAPLTPGTDHPVADADAIVAFAEEHGLPVAIKASYGGGGRGMKVVHDQEDIAAQFESATREAIAAFGRGECFVERYLDRARHVEVQVIADAHGNVVVGSTRDCSVQRRFQKLIEEAPAPFLTAEQNERIYESAKAICRAVNYQGVGTVEYLVGSDGLISFLEVNTRLQVEHPVTEQVTGWDLVREQFRIAMGLPLSRTEDATITGHSIEFRINGEDPANNFMPAPGKIAGYREPSGPGVRVDSGVEAGTLIGGQFDSMMAKLIVSGETRDEAIARAKRALDEYVVEGIPSVIPFHRAVLEDPAFTAPEGALQVYTRWIEEEWENTLEPYVDPAGSQVSADDVVALPRQTVVVEVEGRRLEVVIPGELATQSVGRRRARKRRHDGADIALTGDTVVSPMQGTVITCSVANGDVVEEGDTLLILEAMKMENAIKAHKAGVVASLSVAAGDGVSKNQPLLEVLDADESGADPTPDAAE